MLESWNVLPDEAIVTQILEGHVALFELLMRRHNERLYRAARAIVRDEREAEDVMQQAYVNAYAHLRQFDGPCAVFHLADADRRQRRRSPRAPSRADSKPLDEELSDVETR